MIPPDYDYVLFQRHQSSKFSSFLPTESFQQKPALTLLLRLRSPGQAASAAETAGGGSMVFGMTPSGHRTLQGRIFTQ